MHRWLVILTLFHLLLSVLLIQYHTLETASGLSIKRKLTLSEPIFENVNGERIESIRVGDQGVIKISVTNNLEEEQPFVLLVEIRNTDDVTFHLSWQNATIAQNTMTLETTWTPTEFCHVSDPQCTNFYEIRTFAISDFEEAEVLSIVPRFQGIEVTDLSE